MNTTGFRSWFPKHDDPLRGALGSDATSNIVRESWPDVSLFFRQHEPHDIEEIELISRLKSLAAIRFSGSACSNSLQRFRKRQLMPIRVEHVEITFTPRCVTRTLRP
jgi:hypothetical protein